MRTEYTLFEIRTRRPTFSLLANCDRLRSRFLPKDCCISTQSADRDHDVLTKTRLRKRSGVRQHFVLSTWRLRLTKNCRSCRTRTPRQLENIRIVFSNNRGSQLVTSWIEKLTKRKIVRNRNGVFLTIYIQVKLVYLDQLIAFESILESLT